MMPQHIQQLTTVLIGSDAHTCCALHKVWQMSFVNSAACRGAVVGRYSDMGQRRPGGEVERRVPPASAGFSLALTVAVLFFLIKFRSDGGQLSTALHHTLLSVPDLYAP
jgi:hypothetical protein